MKTPKNKITANVWAAQKIHAKKQEVVLEN